MVNEWKKVIHYSIILICIVSGVAINPIFSLIGLIIACVLILRGSIQELMEVQLILVSFAGLMFFRSTISLLNIVLVVSIIRLLFLCKFQLKRVTMTFFIIILALNWISVLVTNGDAFKDLITFDAGMIMLGLVTQSNEPLNINKTVRYYALALILSSVVCIFSDYLPGLTSYINIVSYRYSLSGERITRYSGLMGNPNYYTLSLNIAISMLLTRAIRNRKSFLDYVLVILMILFGVLSLSKGFIFGLVFNIACLFIYYFFTKPSKGLKLLLTGVLGTMVIICTVGQKYLDILINRLSLSGGVGSIDLNSYTTNRIDKFNLYLDYMSSHIGKIILGNGYGSLIDGQASHNAIIEGIFFFGIVGFVALLIGLNRINSRSKSKGMLRLLPLGILLVRGMGINIWISISLPYYLFLILFEMREEY